MEKYYKMIDRLRKEESALRIMLRVASALTSSLPNGKDLSKRSQAVSITIGLICSKSITNITHQEDVDWVVSEFNKIADEFNAIFKSKGLNEIFEQIKFEEGEK